MKIIVRIFVLCCVFALTCAEKKPPPKQPEPKVLEPCDTFESKVAGVWNDQVLEELDLTVRVYNAELDALDAEHIVGMMSAFPERWVSRRRAACEEHNETDTLGDDAYDRIVECLEGVLTGLGDKIEKFKAGDVQALEPLMMDLDSC